MAYKANKKYLFSFQRFVPSLPGLQFTNDQSIYSVQTWLLTLESEIFLVSFFAFREIVADRNLEIIDLNIRKGFWLYEKERVRGCWWGATKNEWISKSAGGLKLSLCAALFQTGSHRILAKFSSTTYTYSYVYTYIYYTLCSGTLQNVGSIWFPYVL